MNLMVHYDIYLPITFSLSFIGSYPVYSNSSYRRVYTLIELEHLVSYAMDRGIEIVPEIDVPAHSRSWGEAYPEIIVKCPEYSKQKLMKDKKTISQINIENLYTLNPFYAKTYELIDGKYYFDSII